MGKEFWLGRPAGEVEPGEMQELTMQRARGLGGPSAAELMMNMGMQQQIAAGRSMAAGARGVSPGLAMRQAGQRESQAMAGVGQQTSIMRAQEQAMAMQQAQRAELEMAMFNAARQQRQGMLGTVMGVGGQVGAAALGMPWGGGMGGGGYGGGGGWGGEAGSRSDYGW